MFMTLILRRETLEEVRWLVKAEPHYYAGYLCADKVAELYEFNPATYQIRLNISNEPLPNGYKAWIGYDGKIWIQDLEEGSWAEYLAPSFRDYLKTHIFLFPHSMHDVFYFSMEEDCGNFPSARQKLAQAYLSQEEKIEGLVAALEKEAEYQKANYGEVAAWIEQALTAYKEEK